MQKRRSQRALFTISERTFLQDLASIQGRDPAKVIWIYIESSVLHMIATATTVVVDKRTIHFLPLEKSHPHLLHAGILLHLPPESSGVYEKTVSEGGDVRLSFQYPLRRIGEGEDYMAEIAFSTSEGLLVPESTEPRLH